MRRSFLVALILLILLAAFIWIYLPVITKYREMKTQEEKMAQEIRELDEKLRQLEEEKMLLRDDVTYLEKVIREEMGLVRPGETVYKLVEGE